MWCVNNAQSLYAQHLISQHTHNTGDVAMTESADENFLQLKFAFTLQRGFLVPFCALWITCIQEVS